MTRGHSVSTDSVADLAALGKLLEEQRPRLRAMLERRIDRALAARLDADDVLNETFLQAQRKWAAKKGSGVVSDTNPSAADDAKEETTPDPFFGGMTPYAWLYRIALDCLIEAWRRETRGRRNPDREMPFPDRSSVQLGLNLIGTGTTPSSAAARNELQQRIRQALEMLGPRDREILWMRHYDQLSFKEAAGILGIEEGTANVRYVRALQRLKKLWQQLHPEESA